VAWFFAVICVCATAGQTNLMKKILIVEDDLSIQDIFRIIFETYGYDVECMDKGETLYEKKGNWPDAIILDKQLPGISGIEACRFLKNQSVSKDIPVILITASSGIRDAARAAGADDYFEKPFDMQTILKKVSHLIKKDSVL
jgi:DNA-binding response OmpR family regulator